MYLEHRFLSIVQALEGYHGEDIRVRTLLLNNIRPG